MKPNVTEAEYFAILELSLVPHTVTSGKHTHTLKLAALELTLISNISRKINLSNNIQTYTFYLMQICDGDIIVTCKTILNKRLPVLAGIWTPETVESRSDTIKANKLILQYR